MAVPDGECSHPHGLFDAEWASRLSAQNDWRFKNHVSRANARKAVGVTQRSILAVDHQRQYQSLLRRASDYEFWQKLGDCR